MKYIDIVVKKQLPGKIETVFEFVVPIDINGIFVKRGPIPRVTGSSNKEKWYTPGMKRTIFFEDHSTAEETLLEVDAYHSFTYVIENFTSALKYFVERIDGHWKFSQLDQSSTHIEWTYSIKPRNIIGGLIILFYIKRHLQFVLNQAMENIYIEYIKKVEQGN